MPASDVITREEICHYLWRKGDLSYKRDSLQIEITERIRNTPGDCHAVICSRQIGKSWNIDLIALEECIRFANENKGILVRVLAPTLKAVFDIVRDNLAKICADVPPGLIVPTKSDLRWLIGGKSQLRLGPLERAHVDSNRGGNADIIIFEEGGFVKSDDYEYAVESVIGPQLLRSGGREYHISSISEDEHHYLHTTIMPKCEAIKTLSSYTIYDSPSLSEDQVRKAIERSGGAQSEAFRREYLNEIIRSKSSTVIPEFSEAEHVRDFTLPPYYNALIAIDQGGKRDMTGILSVVYDFANARTLIWNEAQLDANSPTGVMVKRATDLESELNWGGQLPKRVADVPGQVQVDLVHHYNYILGILNKDDADAAIQSLRLQFQTGKVLIHPRCKNLIGCLKTGRYNDKRTDFERSALYGHLDILMALVYGNRMLDRHTNPYPKITAKEDQLFIDRKDKNAELEKLAKAFAPYNPMRRSR